MEGEKPELYAVEGGAGAPPAPEPEIISPEKSGLACLALVLRYYEMPADPAQLAHEFAPEGQPFGTDDILRAAKARGLKAKKAQASWARLEGLPTPAILRLDNGSYVLLGRASDEKALLLRPGSAKPELMDEEGLAAIWSGQAILLTRRGFGSPDEARFDISWFIPALWKYRAIFGEVFVASFFLQLFALVTPIFFQVVMDKVLVHRALTTLDVLFIGLVALGLFEAVLGGLRTYVFSHTTSRVDVILGARVFRHLMRLPMSWFGARRVGDSVARVRELETIRNFLTGSALTLVIDLFFTIVFLVVMWFYSPFLCAIVLGSLPFYVALSLAVSPLLRARVKEKFNKGAANQAFLVEAVSGVETLKSMAVEPAMQRRWEDQLSDYVGASFKARNLGNIASQTAQLIAKLVTAFVLFFGAKLVMAGALTVGQLVAFNMFAQRVAQPVLRLAQMWQDFQQARISVARLGDILNAPAEPAYNPDRGSLPAIQGRVAFDNVTFRYRPGGPEVLSDITFEIPPGKVIGVVGPSGSGKSTLTKLIQRIHVPERGRVLVDGVDLGLSEPAWLRRQIGVVLQDNVLFNRSVRDNIALTNPGMEMERVIAAARLAGAHDFVLELPEGYDTILGERGASLSGGQRQRIAIARALVTDPRILILDEATSALDYESERIIQQNMRQIVKGRTVFIIAHRLSAVRQADAILTVEGGRITEHGTHDQLLKKGGRYARLWALQSGEVA